MAGLRITDTLVIPENELSWRFSATSGPGGQHANRSQTRAELSFDLGRSSVLPPDLLPRMLARLGTRAPGGIITVSVDESRSQWRNRQTARRRLAELLADSLEVEPERRPTKPSRASVRERLQRKRRRGQTKRLRKPPEVE